MQLPIRINTVTLPPSLPLPRLVHSQPLSIQCTRPGIQAIVADDAHNYKEAFDHYCKAIEKFVIVSRGAPGWVGDTVRPRVEVYVKRAECLKKLLADEERKSLETEKRETRQSNQREKLERRLVLRDAEITRMASEISVLSTKIRTLTTQLEEAQLELQRTKGPSSRPVEHFCTITSHLLRDPVMTTCGCGATVEREAVRRWFSAGHASCPQCLAPLASDVVLPNVALRNIIQRWPNSGHPV